jgi:hypothetical protein
MNKALRVSKWAYIAGLVGLLVVGIGLLIVTLALLQRGVAVRNNHCGGKTPMRESQLTQIAKLAYHIAQQTLPTYSHPKSRHDYTFPQRVACVMLKIYLNYTYRDLEEWLLATDQVRQPLQLTRVPDHATRYRTFAKLSQQQWQPLNDALLQHLQVNEMTVAVDTTGFRNDTASAYAVADAGGVRGARAGLRSVRRAS